MAHTLCAFTIFRICSFFISKSPKSSLQSAELHTYFSSPFFPTPSARCLPNRTRMVFWWGWSGQPCVVLTCPRVGGSNRGSITRMRALSTRVSECPERDRAKRELTNEFGEKNFNVKNSSDVMWGGRQSRSQSLQQSWQQQPRWRQSKKKSKKSQWVQEVVRFMWSFKGPVWGLACVQNYGANLFVSVVIFKSFIKRGQIGRSIFIQGLRTNRPTMSVCGGQIRKS